MVSLHALQYSHLLLYLQLVILLFVDVEQAVIARSVLAQRYIRLKRADCLLLDLNQLVLLLTFLLLLFIQ